MAKILVVDDEPHYCESLRWLLEAGGHEVDTAGDADDAIELARQNQPDILVIDYLLGDRLNGIEVAQLLGERLPHLLKVVITGVATDDVKTVFSETDRSTAILEKPFCIEELDEAIQNLRASLDESP